MERNVETLKFAKNSFKYVTIQLVLYNIAIV